MTTMLLGVFTNGTGASAQPAGFRVAGKTGSTEVPNSYGFGTKDQWIVGYTPDVVVATWVGYDRTNKQHFMHGVSETEITRLYKAEMEGILPYTAQNQFTEQAPKQIIQNNGTGSDWTNGLNDKIQKGIGSAGEKLNEWYNNLKGLFDR